MLKAGILEVNHRLLARRTEHEEHIARARGRRRKFRDRRVIDADVLSLRRRRVGLRQRDLAHERAIHFVEPDLHLRGCVGDVAINHTEPLVTIAERHLIESDESVVTHVEKESPPLLKSLGNFIVLN